MGLHDGHRQRLIQRFLEEDLDNFEPHNVLELLLFYAIPRKDTNELAHVLIDTFGSLKGVFDAPYEELVKVNGIGSNAAALLKLVPSLTRTYYSSDARGMILDTSEKSGEYFLPYYIGQTEEVVRLACLDAGGKVISNQILHRGSANAAEVNIRKIVNIALRNNAMGVILAHNHPGGLPLPSEEDVATTKSIREALIPMGILLMDHIIVAGQDYVSMARSGII
ncbi:MAG: DNA repair protein RadC [Clostridia bacterium]|nr:DNA repair protein RadC [Clostridia bacterium]